MALEDDELFSRPPLQLESSEVSPISLCPQVIPAVLSLSQTSGLNYDSHSLCHRVWIARTKITFEVCRKRARESVEFVDPLAV